jgi:putative nucleotidyltransferase with HDIG domain
MQEKKLLTLFPEFAWIQNAKLRQKTVRCWLEALEQGGWSLEDLDRMPFTLLINDCTVSFRTHVRSVTQMAAAAAKIFNQHYQHGPMLNLDWVVSGGLLHDIGKLLEFRLENGRFVKSENGKLLRHPFSGAALAAKNDLPENIVHIIATHAKEGDGGYRTPESIIVHHADFMNFEPLK